MLQAELRRKISGNRPESIHDRLEDILTSNVFGAFRYLPPEKGILPFLRSAKNTRLEPLVVPERVRDVEWEFWPRLPDRREPDLLLTLKCDAGPHHILIEAKFEAPKHGTDEETWEDRRDNERRQAEPEDEGTGQQDAKDQLAKYLLALPEYLAQGNANYHPGKTNSSSLVYVTKSMVMPLGDLKASERSASRRRPGLANRFYWTHWGEALRVFEAMRSDPLPVWENNLVEDLCNLLAEKKGFLYFRGVRVPGSSVEPPDARARLWQETFLWARRFPPSVSSVPYLFDGYVWLQVAPDGPACPLLAASS